MATSPIDISPLIGGGLVQPGGGYVPRPPSSPGVSVPASVAAEEQDKEIDITWADASGVTWIVQGSDDGEDWTELDSGLTEPTYTETGLTYQQTRYYRVFATDGVEVSSASSTVSATTIPVLPKSAAHLAKIGHPAASVGLRFDVASGNVTDFIGSVDFVATGEPTYGVDSSDLSGQKAISMALGAFDGFACESTSAGDPADGSFSVLFIGRIDDATSNTQNAVINKRGGSGAGFLSRLTGTTAVANLFVQDGDGFQQISVSENHVSTLMTYVASVDRNAGTIAIATQLGQNSAALTLSGESVGNSEPLCAGGAGPSRSSAHEESLYALVLLGANAEENTAPELRDFWVSRLTDAGAYA